MKEKSNTFLGCVLEVDGTGCNSPVTITTLPCGGLWIDPSASTSAITAVAGGVLPDTF